MTQPTRDDYERLALDLQQMAERIAALEALLRESKREHHVNEEEGYYSCASLQPKRSALFGPCDCGADDWNARVDNLLGEQR